jgi:hypothetical protein
VTHLDRPAAVPRPTRAALVRTAAVAVVGLGLVLGVVGPASGASDSVGAAQAALRGATAEREAAEARVRSAEARNSAASTEVERLGSVDAELTQEVAEARRALREYAIAAYIDGGQSEILRSTLTIEQSQALAWQSNMLMGQSVSADQAADRYESLKASNEPAVLAAATELDRAGAALRDARFDLIQASAFERDAESALRRAREAAARAAAQREAAQQADTRQTDTRQADTRQTGEQQPGQRTSSAVPAPSGGGSAPEVPAGGAVRGNPTAAESAILAKIRRCESRGNYSIVSPSGRYRGAYQFDIPTWRSVGGTGDPAAASPAEQDYRALLLLRARGTRPWPNCGR